MIRFLLLLLVGVALAVALVPDLRRPLGWVLAFLSLLMLGDLIRGSFARHRSR